MTDLELNPLQIAAVTDAIVRHKATIGFAGVPDDEVAKGAVHIYAGLCTIVPGYAAASTLDTPEGQNARDAIARLYWFIMLMREISNGTFDQRPANKLN